MDGSSRSKATDKALISSLAKLGSSVYQGLRAAKHRFAGRARRAPERIARLRALTREKPLILQIETINVCNALCVFCGYKSMKRQKGIMNLELFEKIVSEYADMGGGAVSLTPIVGDVLLDPHLIERFHILEKYPKINQITLTTNGIALDKFSDDQVSFLLERIDVLQVSIGGLDKEMYKTMYAVDRFEQVDIAMKRLLKLKQQVNNPPKLTFAFRTNDHEFEQKNDAVLEAFKEQGAYISHIATYANYSGLVEADEKIQLDVTASPIRKDRTCGVASAHLGVCSDGKITACGCADVQGEGLIIGNAIQERLGDVWRSNKRTGFLNSFEQNKLAKLCQDCSFYRSDEDLFSQE